MRMFLIEYSLAVMYVISVISVILIVFFAVNNERTGFVVTYNTNMVYANDLVADDTALSQYEQNGKFDSIESISNVTNTLHKPTFVVDNSAVNDDYIIPVPSSGSAQRSTYTYDEALNLFSANGKVHLYLWDSTSNSYKDQGLPSTVEIVITKMTPSYRGTDGTLATEMVEAKDKYGNVIRDINGNPRMVEQVLYNEESYSRDNIDAFYIDWDTSCRYRVLFRYTDGVLKSEYSAMYANKIRSASEIYEEVYEEWVGTE